jgi:hypothetical protein
MEETRKKVGRKNRLPGFFQESSGQLHFLFVRKKVGRILPTGILNETMNLSKKYQFGMANRLTDNLLSLLQRILSFEENFIAAADSLKLLACGCLFETYR